jgi:flagellar basal body P-ring formation protein FlgA
MGVRRICSSSVAACLIVLIVVGAPSGGVIADGGAKVFLEGSVKIPDHVMLLGDVACIEGPEDLAEHLRSVSLGNAPLPGRSINISADHIRMRLRQEGVYPHSVSVSGKSSVTVIREHSEIGEEEIADAVRAYIAANAPWSSEEMTIAGVRVSGAVTVPPGRVTIHVQAPGRADYLGSVPFSVIVDVDGEYRRKIWAIASIEVTAEVVVTERPINRYQRIEHQDVSVRRVNLADVSSSSIRDIEQALEKRAKRKIGPNEVLRTDMVEFPTLVKRGDRVFIVAESPGLRITTLGEARENGVLGETIRIVNLNSKKSLHGSIIDVNTVRVDF